MDKAAQPLTAHLEQIKHLLSFTAISRLATVNRIHVL
jgi:hypothetical protein